MKLNIAALCTVSMLCIFFACNTSDSGEKESALRSLEKEVLAIHDEVMPRMTEIESLRESLVTELQNQALDSIQLAAMREAVDNLEAGDSLMWDWMHNYSIPEGVPDDSVVRYLKLEKGKIEHVSNMMQSSITSAEGLLQKLGHGQSH